MKVATVALAALSATATAAHPRFEDLSARLPSHVYSGGWEHFVGGGVAVFDCDDDGLPEIAAAGGTNPARLFANRGDMRFESADFPDLTGVTGIWPADLDGDGQVDLVATRVGANVALRGDGACGFAPTDWLPADATWSTAFTAWWPPGAARPTLAIGNYVDRADPDGPFEACDDNAILRPVGEGWLTEPLSPGFCALSILAARDARDRPTLRLSNDRHYYVRGGAEQMWDIADERFLGPEDGWDGPSLWGMGIASRDLDGDGLSEVMLTSMGDQLLQIARDGGYVAAPFETGTYATTPHTGGDGRPSTGWHAEFGDVDNDGRADLFIAKGNVDQMPGNAMQDPNNLLMQQAGGSFEEAAALAGVATVERSRGAALADLDGDGRLDLVVVNRRAAMELYRNVTSATGNWIAVDPRQSGPNAFAVGAVVEVEGQVIERTLGGGHGGGQLLPLHFGLGPASDALVRITWPDGRVSESRHRAGGVVTIQR